MERILHSLTGNVRLRGLHGHDGETLWAGGQQYREVSILVIDDDISLPRGTREGDRIELPIAIAVPNLLIDDYISSSFASLAPKRGKAEPKLFRVRKARVWPC